MCWDAVQFLAEEHCCHKSWYDLQCWPQRTRGRPENHTTTDGVLRLSQELITNWMFCPRNIRSKCWAFGPQGEEEETWELLLITTGTSRTARNVADKEINCRTEWIFMKALRRISKVRLWRILLLPASKYPHDRVTTYSHLLCALSAAINPGRTDTAQQFRLY